MAQFIDYGAKMSFLLDRQQANDDLKTILQKVSVSYHIEPGDDNLSDVHPRWWLVTFFGSFECLDDRFLVLFGQRPEKRPPLLPLDFFCGMITDVGRLLHLALNEDALVDARRSPCKGAFDCSLGILGSGFRITSRIRVKVFRPKIRIAAATIFWTKRVAISSKMVGSNPKTVITSKTEATPKILANFHNARDSSNSLVASCSFVYSDDE